MLNWKLVMILLTWFSLAVIFLWIRSHVCGANQLGRHASLFVISRVYGSACCPAVSFKCLRKLGPILLAKREDSFSHPFASKIKISKEEFPLHVKIRRSFSFSSWALTKSSHPDVRSSSSSRFSTLKYHISPLATFRSSPLVICLLKFFTNFAGML